MPYQPDRLRPTLAADSDALACVPVPGGTGDAQLAETRVEPISVPRPQPYDTVTIGVVTGRPLKLEFAIDEVKTREVARDDLILGFENGGKVVLKDFMHAFGLLGDQRTTIIQPDGKHYAFTDLLAPTPGARPEAPGTDAIVVDKPAPGETQHVKLGAEKPVALNFGKSDIAYAAVDKAGDLVVTFKDRGVLVLEGYAALKDSGDLALHFTKGDPFALADLAPAAAPAEGTPEGGHLFTSFEPGAALGPLDHLGALGPEPVSLIAPPGPPESPPPLAPPPAPASERPPEIPPPPQAGCPPRADETAPDAAARGEGGSDGLTLIVAAGMDIAGDVENASGLWGAAAQGAPPPVPSAEAAQRGWIEGHDAPAETATGQAAALAASAHAAASGDAGGDAATTVHAAAESAPMASKDMFDSGDAAPAAAPAHADAGAGAFAAAIDFAAAAAAAPTEAAAAQVQNPAQHNVMGHG